MRKVCIIQLIGLGLPVLLAAQSALGDSGADLKQAEGLCKAGKYAQAEQVCRRVLQNEPNNPEAVYQAGKMLPQVYLAAGQLPQAKEAVKDLLARSAKHEYLPHALHEMIEQAKPINKTAQAGQICRDLLNGSSQPAQAIWLKMGIALADVYGGNDQAVDAQARDIIAGNAADPGAAEALAQIGWAYVKLGQDKKARPLYEYVVQNWSGKPRAMHAHTALVRSCIRLNDKEAAAGQVQNLVKQYSENPELPKILNEIARGYREARMYDEARNVSQYILANYPGHEQRIWADRDIILCDVAQQHQDDAQAGLQKLTRDHASNGYLPLVLREIADQYRQGQRYTEARALWQYVLDNYPSSEECLWVQRGIVLDSLVRMDMERAREGTEVLLTKYGRQSGAWWAVQDIADMYGMLRQHERARELHQWNLANHPTADDTIWSMRGVIRESIAMKDMAAIDAGIKKLLSEYASSRSLPMAAIHIGRELCDAGNPRAADVFEYVIAKHPDDEKTLVARVCLGYVYAMKGKGSQAETLYDEILTRYASHPDLPEAVHTMAEGYYDCGKAAERDLMTKLGPDVYTDGVIMYGRPESVKRYYQAAAQKWEIIITRFPDAPIAPKAYQFAAICYEYMNDYRKAMEYATAIVERYPSCTYADRAHFTIVRMCEKLRDQGGMTNAEAMPVILAASQTILTQYPQSPFVVAAQKEVDMAAEAKDREDKEPANE